PRGLPADTLHFEEYRPFREEPSWLTEYRLEAFSLLRTAHVSRFWPSGRDEGFIVPPDASLVAQYYHHPDEADVVYRKLAESLAFQGVVYGDFFDVLRTYPDLIKEYLGSIIPYTESTLAAMNMALFTGGMVVYVPQNVKCQVPLSYFRAFSNPGQIERQLIIIGSGADAGFVEGRPSLDYAPSHLVQTEIVVEDDASFSYTAVKNWDKQINTWVQKRARCLDRSQMTWVEGHFGGHDSHEWTETLLAGEASHANVVAYAYTSASQAISYCPRIVHEGKSTTSHLIVHAIAQGKLSIDGGQCVLSHAHHCDLTRDILVIESESGMAAINNQSLVAQKDAVLTGPEFTVRPWHTEDNANPRSEALEISRTFLSHLPMEFSIEAQRLISQKSQED
ncbi:MAG: SufD family Fe-S cluster assembly protein, partial [Firmicutes bacterium]|nr:SufD family Fe-S cluster assembly protein [Bacillota bacterium]